jgi:hypothetical protein
LWYISSYSHGTSSRPLNRPFLSYYHSHSHTAPSANIRLSPPHVGDHVVSTFAFLLVQQPACISQHNYSQMLSSPKAPRSYPTLFAIPTPHPSKSARPRSCPCCQASCPLGACRRASCRQASWAVWLLKGERRVHRTHDPTQATPGWSARCQRRNVALASGGLAKIEISTCIFKENRRGEGINTHSSKPARIPRPFSICRYDTRRWSRARPTFPSMGALVGVLAKVKRHRF